MIFEFGKYIIDVDVEKTREFYRYYTYGCTCDGCKNFRKYAEICPDALKKWFEMLGLEIGKPSEVFYINEEDENKLFYGGWWHLCGKVINTDRHTEILENGTKAIVSEGYYVTENFNVSFHNECNCVPWNFPKPCIQIDISARLELPKRTLCSE